MVEELVGIIGGTGLGDALAAQLEDVESWQVETPFGRPSMAIMVGGMAQRRVAFINRHGDGHKLSPSEVPFAANTFALKKLGVHAVIATAAVGSLRDEIQPGDLVVVDQLIDKTFRRQGSFFGGYGAVHCEMADPVCGRLRQVLQDTAKEMDLRTHGKGTYVCMEGPQFSTRAESLMHRAWGGDLIGMTGMPEAKLAREAQMCYALVALASDYDCWRQHEAGEDEQTLLEEIIANMRRATENCLRLIEAVLASERRLVSEQCACRRSLGLAVLTDEKKIEPAVREKLRILFE